MFDANMRHLPKGRIFYCNLHSCTEDSPLAAIGHHRGSIVFCEMLSEQHKNPLVRFWSPDRSEKVEVRARCSEYKTYAVYEGQVDGRDFINEKSKADALSQDAKHNLKVNK